MEVIKYLDWIKNKIGISTKLIKTERNFKGNKAFKGNEAKQIGSSERSLDEKAYGVSLIWKHLQKKLYTVMFSQLKLN